MRLLILSFIFSVSSVCFAQDEYMLWTEIGASGDLMKKMDWYADFTSRIGKRGLETFFPQVGIEYKVKKWFKPSLEYRLIIDKNSIGNYKSSNRLNLNANFKKDIDRWGLSARVRYQLAFKRLVGSNYNDDFDPAIRLKPAVSYDIDNCILTPKASAEFFYNPTYGPKGPGFTKVRMAIGASLELDGPHDFSFKYQVDKRFNDYEAGLRHVLVLSYSYKFK